MVTIGFVINPYAGRGREFALKIGRKVIERLAKSSDKFITGPKNIGENVLSGFDYIVVGTDATKLKLWWLKTQ